MNGRKPQRFLPFSQGSRDCVGQTLARLNLATTLAQLYGSFSFHLAPQVQPLYRHPLAIQHMIAFVILQLCKCLILNAQGRVPQQFSVPIVSEVDFG